MVKYRIGKKVNNHLDDFFFARLLLRLCNGQVNEFLKICSYIISPVLMDKTFWRRQLLVFLGILINAVTQTVSIPLEKRDKAFQKLEVILSSQKTMVLRLQNITGILNFISTALYPSRVFTRRLYVKFSDTQLKQHYHVKVDVEIKGKLAIWKQWLLDKESVSRPFIDFSTQLVVNQINFFTDASRKEDFGFGCVFGDRWTQSQWPGGLMNDFGPSIKFLELFAVTLAIHL